MRHDENNLFIGQFEFEVKYLGIVIGLVHLPVFAVVWMNSITLFTIVGFSHKASMSFGLRLRDLATAANSLARGTINAITYVFPASAYTQTLSTREQRDNTDSTFPKATYSPAWSLTKSFLRSMINTKGQSSSLPTRRSIIVLAYAICHNQTNAKNVVKIF